MGYFAEMCWLFGNKIPISHLAVVVDVRDPLKDKLDLEVWIEHLRVGIWGYGVGVGGSGLRCSSYFLLFFILFSICWVFGLMVPSNRSSILKVDVRLPGKGNSNSHGAMPVHLIITMIKWIRTSRLSIKNSLSREGKRPCSGNRCRPCQCIPCR